MEGGIRLDYRRECIEELRNYQSKLRSLQSLPEEAKICDAQMDGVRSVRLDATPVKGGGSSREDFLINTILKKDKVKENLKIVSGQVAQIEKALDGLTPKQRRILELFYIRRESGYIQRLCAEFNECERQIYYDKDEALRQYTISKYGITEL